MFVGFLFLILLTAVVGESSEKVCSYQDVLNYLNLTRNNELFSMTRPVKDYKQPTRVTLELLLYAILDVESILILRKDFQVCLFVCRQREIDQTFIPYVWIVVTWQNEHIQWNPEDFCGIETVSLPAEVLWRPDLTIEEMTEKDRAPLCPHLTIFSNGSVSVQNDQVLVSTCRMHVYKFPFDIQSCSLSFRSVIHSVEEIQLVHYLSSSEATATTMRTQYEWLFVNMTVTNRTANMFGFKQDVMVYTISMKRRPLLYVVNFLLPVFFLLCLDLSSFLISDSGGEKLSFKVTVLLAVTVMQLILNEILPSSSDRIPLIVVYCIGIFGLMMLSLLETILVMYLLGKDSVEENETDGDGGQREDCNKQGKANGEGGDEKKWTACSDDASADGIPAEPLKQESSSQLSEEEEEEEEEEEAQVFEKLSNELKEVKRTVLGNRKPGYWTRMTKTINKAFFIFYVSATSLFLLCMFLSWNNDGEEVPFVT